MSDDELSFQTRIDAEEKIEPKFDSIRYKIRGTEE